MDKIILVHYINTTNTGRERNLMNIAMAKEHSQAIMNNVDNLIMLVIASETKPTSVECVYPTVHLASEEDYEKIREELKKVTDLLKPVE